jgi:predicted nucleic-acid-binding protein
VIGLETNVLLRMFDENDPEQRARAHALVSAQGFGGCYLNPIVISEFAWTLARSYKRQRGEIVQRLSWLLEAPEFVVAHADEAARALNRYLSGPADFADYFLAEINESAGCSRTATFDEDALQSTDLFFAVLESP